MKREDLIESARTLPVPSPEAAREYGARRERLAEAINRAMGARRDLDRLVGGHTAMMEDNHRNHARFMESLFLAWDPEVLVDTVIWVFRAYRSHGFALTYWPAQLDTWVSVLRENLSASTFASIYPVYHWMITQQPFFAALSDEGFLRARPSREEFANNT
jgi:hypothetical protein